MINSFLSTGLGKKEPVGRLEFITSRKLSFKCHKKFPDFCHEIKTDLNENYEAGFP